jgi:SAM-dependent methyltransferase
MTATPTRSRPHYGIDAPPIPALLGAAGVASALAAASRRTGRATLAVTSVVLLAGTGIYLHTTLRGKLRTWDEILDRAAFKGDEQLLDMGCGRGAVLIAAARRLPQGRAGGVDLWSADQSGNRPEATLANAAAAGVADRVDVRSGDMTALPFPDNSFDIVTSAMAIHNVPSTEGRHRALDEAIRVLRPGGRLFIADPAPFVRKYAVHLGQGTPRALGPRYWYSGPWIAVSLLHVVNRGRHRARPVGATHRRMTDPPLRPGGAAHRPNEHVA